MTAKGYVIVGLLKRNLRVNSPILKAKAYASILRPLWNTVVLFGTLVKAWKTMVPTI